MYNKLQVETPFSLERVENKLEDKNNNSVKCSSCQKCKHAFGEPQKVQSQDGRLKLERKTANL